MLKLIKRILKEAYASSYSERNYVTKILKPSIFQIPNMMGNLPSREARFVIDHSDKFRMGDAENLIHIHLAADDVDYDFMSMSNAKNEATMKKARYFGYISFKNKTFSIAELDSTGDRYDPLPRDKPPSHKAEELINFLSKRGYQRLRDGNWPR